jgi:hypothetical protein
MRKSLAALRLAILLGSTTALIAGCGKATTEAVCDGQCRGGVAYVASGWLLPSGGDSPAMEELLAIPDANARRDAFLRSTWPVKTTFLVPRATFQWLFKRAAKARRLDEATEPAS